MKSFVSHGRVTAVRSGQVYQCQSVNLLPAKFVSASLPIDASKSPSGETAKLATVMFSNEIPGMLTDRFPDLQKLDAQEKLILAGELWFDATHSGSGSPAPDLPAELVEKIEKRLDAYLADLTGGIEWDELKRRMLDAKDH